MKLKQTIAPNYYSPQFMLTFNNFNIVDVKSKPLMESDQCMLLLKISLYAGATVGAITAGKYIFLGRRSLMLAACCVGIIGSCMTVFLDFKVMI